MRERLPRDLTDPGFLDRVAWFCTYATDRRSRLRAVAERFQLSNSEAAAILDRLGFERPTDETKWTRLDR